MSNLPTRQPKINYPAKVNVQKSIAAGRTAGIPGEDVRKLLACGRLGRTIPDQEAREIAKGVLIDRWSKINAALKRCAKILARKNIDHDVRIALMQSESEFLKDLAKISEELNLIGNRAPSPVNGQFAPHSFNPREQIGTVTAVQVNIGRQEREKSPVTDVPLIQSLPDAPSS